MQVTNKNEKLMLVTGVISLILSAYMLLCSIYALSVGVTYSRGSVAFGGFLALIATGIAVAIGILLIKKRKQLGKYPILTTLGYVLLILWMVAMALCGGHAIVRAVGAFIFGAAIGASSKKKDVLAREQAALAGKLPEEKRVVSADSLAKIKQLKELLDAGAITQAEFDEKKKELL